MIEQQANCVMAHPNIEMAIVGHENSVVSLYDLGGKRIHTIESAHGDAGITSVTTNSGLQFVTGGHDGMMRFWDIRNYKCVQEVQAHQRKYDEALACIEIHPTLPLIASGGADSIVNLFEGTL